MCVRGLSNSLPEKRTYCNPGTDTAVHRNAFVDESSMCSALHTFCHTIDTDSVLNRIVCNRCYLHPQNVSLMHFSRCLYFVLWFDCQTKMDSVVANTLNYYYHGNRIFGGNATAFSLFPSLSQFDAIGGVAVAAVDAVDVVAVATVIDLVDGSRP